MTIQALGYLGIGTDRIDDWTSYATNWLGMQAVDRGAGVRAFRMDDRKQRLVIDRSLPEGQRYFGWEVADAASLDTLAARLEAAGVSVKREPSALADQRFVRGLISFADPSGNRLEAFHGAHIADEPFRPGRSISGFRTGPMGMGHVVLLVTDIDTALPFYCDLLGFRVSDFIREPSRRTRFGKPEMAALPLGADGKFFASTGAAAGDHGAAVLRFHSRKEPVVLAR